MSPLELGAEATQVNVSAEAPLLQTTTATLGSDVGNRTDGLAYHF